MSAYLPSLSKTWLFVDAAAASTMNVSILAAATGLASNQKRLRKMTDVLQSFATVGWTCVGSCNGTGGAGSFTAPASPWSTNTSKWTADSSLVWAVPGSNHSWIVLKQAAFTAGNAGLQLCIDLSNGVSNNLTAMVSASAGFTGGSATARPTATDETPIVNNTSWFNASASTLLDARLNVMMSNDGLCTRVLWYEGGTAAAKSFMLIDQPVSPLDAWDDPSLFLWRAAASGDIPTYTNYYSAANASAMINGTAAAVYLSCESRNGAALGTVLTGVNALGGGYWIGPVGLVTESLNVKGEVGYLPDIWWTVTGQAANLMPASGGKTFAVHGNMLFPHDGSALSFS